MDEPMQAIGRVLIAFGAVAVFAGPVRFVSPKIPFFRQISGDVHVRREHPGVYVPLAPSLIVCLVRMIVVSLYQCFSRK